MRIRHNPAKYERRKAIREECGRRLQAARRNGSATEYSRALEDYLFIRDKIRRYYSHWGLNRV